MAKKKKKKKNKHKLPKSIAGVAIPRELRSPGLTLTGILESPVAREILAGVLTAIAAALASNKNVRQGVAEASATAVDTGKEAADQAATGTRDLALAAADVVAGVARHVLPSAITGEGSRSDDSKRDSAGSEDFASLAETPDKDEKKGKGRDKRAH